MIEQHLILRCKKGEYDQSLSAGLKTASVSEGIKNLPSVKQKEIEKIISKYALFPDISKGGIIENRGILRIIQKKAMLLALRTFRVCDLCDNRGDVSFTHTYIFVGDERTFILENPESLCNLSGYDDYADIDSRCGGLSNGKEILISGKIVMPDKSLKLQGGIFEECGFDKSSFSKLISDLCTHIFSKGSVAVIPFDCSEKEWDNYGGSEKGEKFICGLISLLPNCITRFFSGVSYWNEDPFDDTINEYKLRILSGRYSDNLTRNGTSVFDMRTGRIFSSASESTFGNYLWDNRNNHDEIRAFHLYISGLFGENVDKIVKLPVIMDAVTELYLKSKSDDYDVTNAISIFTLMVGVSLPVFPKIYRNISEQLVNLKNSNGKIPENLETSIVTLLKNKDSKNLSNCYETYIYLIFKNILIGNAKDESILFITENIIDSTNSGNEYYGRFQHILSQFKGNIETVPSDSVIKLFIEVYNRGETYANYRYDLGIVIENIYQKLYTDKKFSLCVDILLRQLDNAKNDDEIKQLLSRVSNLIRYITPDNRMSIIKKILEYIDRNSGNSYKILEIAKVLFGEEKESPLAEDEGFFPIFVRILVCVINFTDYVKDVWYSQYSSILEKYSVSSVYFRPEEYLSSFSGIEKAYSLFYIEVARISSKKYKSNWNNINSIIEGFSKEETKKKYECLSYIINLNKYNISEDEFEDFIQLSYNTTKMYGLFLFSFSENDATIEIFEKYISKDKYTLDKIIEVAENESLLDNISAAYKYIWEQVNPDFRNVDIGTKIKRLMGTEKSLSKKAYCTEIMEKLGESVQSIFSTPSNIISLKSEELLFIVDGIKKYGWDKTVNISSRIRKTIEICSNIDIGEDADTMYFINLLDSMRYDSETGTIIEQCTDRINIVKDNCIEPESIIAEKRALLAFVKVFSKSRNNNISKSYSDVLHMDAGNDYYSSVMILYAMNYLFKLSNVDSKYIKEFSDGFERSLKNMSESRIQTLLSTKFQNIYSVIKTRLDTEYQKKFYNIIKSVDNPELKEMFKVQEPKPVAVDNTTKTSSENKIIQIVIMVLIPVISVIIFLFSPLVSVVISAVILLIIVIFDVVLWIMIKKKGT
ncbi:MAG: hypothetical protein K2J32_11120 [Ruminococcus sp.]|nr:hypothetical protein [Ruminococcus sp.]